MVSATRQSLNGRPTVRVCLTPELIANHDCAESVVVVIDVLRATTTICTALALGAEAVIPVERAEDCLQFGAQGCLTAGERGGEKLPGFDLGNSPLELFDVEIKGRRLALTTTNGTRALYASLPCKALAIGAFSNLSVLSEWLAAEGLPVILHCAGWRGEPNWEDTLLAGLLVERLRETHATGNDAALLAQTAARLDGQKQQEMLEASSHFPRLRQLGAGADLDFCFQVDVQPVLPLFDGQALTDALRQRAR